MNNEKMNEIISDPVDIKSLINEINVAGANAQEMIKNGEAYYIDEYDKDNKLKTIKIFNNAGEMIFFKDFEGLNIDVKKSN